MFSSSSFTSFPFFSISIIGKKRFAFFITTSPHPTFKFLFLPSISAFAIVLCLGTFCPLNQKHISCSFTDRQAGISPFSLALALLVYPTLCRPHNHVLNATLTGTSFFPNIIFLTTPFTRSCSMSRHSPTLHAYMSSYQSLSLPTPRYTA